MKKTFIFSLMAAALALVSCTKTELTPLKGIYPAAQEPVLTTLASSSFEKTESNRIFHVVFTGEGGASVDAYLVAARAQYFLEPGVYGPGNKNLCFLSDGQTKVNGKAVKDGQISVKKDGDNYRFVFVLFDTEGNPYRAVWQGELVYEPDPEPVRLTQVLTAQSNVASGTNSVTLSLGTAGLESANGSVTGEGNYLAVDFYSADGYLHEGTYTASAAGGAIGEGEFGIGWDPGDLWGIGWVFENWGTCWWTVSGGAATARKITSGTLTVQQKGSKFIITWGSEATYPDWAVFEGAIEALTPGDAPSETVYPAREEVAPVAEGSSVMKHTVTVSDEDGAVLAVFEFLLSEGETSLAGTYDCQEYASEAGLLCNGYNFPDWGISGGSFYMQDGARVDINAGETVTVTAEGSGIYRIVGSTGYSFLCEVL